MITFLVQKSLKWTAKNWLQVLLSFILFVSTFLFRFFSEALFKSSVEKSWKQKASLSLFSLQSLSLPAAGQWEGERKPSRADRALLSGTAGPFRLWQHQERSHPCAYVRDPPHIAPVSLGYEGWEFNFVHLCGHCFIF